MTVVRGRLRRWREPSLAGARSSQISTASIDETDPQQRALGVCLVCGGGEI